MYFVFFQYIKTLTLNIQYSAVSVSGGEMNISRTPKKRKSIEVNFDQSLHQITPLYHKKTSKVWDSFSFFKSTDSEFTCKSFIALSTIMKEKNSQSCCATNDRTKSR